jgi:hypothetical protein
MGMALVAGHDDGERRCVAVRAERRHPYVVGAARRLHGGCDPVGGRSAPDSRGPRRDDAPGAHRCTSCSRTPRARRPPAAAARSASSTTRVRSCHFEGGEDGNVWQRPVRPAQHDARCTAAATWARASILWKGQRLQHGRDRPDVRRRERRERCVLSDTEQDALDRVPRAQLPVPLNPNLDPATGDS